MASRFHFHGEALAFAGRVRVPFQEVIPGQAGSTLSEIGGYCTAVSRDFRYRELIQFDLAHTEVTGSDTGRSYATLIQCTVEGLNINGMVSADRIVARLYSSYRNEPDGEPAIRLIGTRFENLKIAGVPVTVDLATDVFDHLDKHHKVCTAYEKDPDFRKLFGEVTLRDAFDELAEMVQRWVHRPPRDAGTLPSNKGFTEVSLARKVTAPGLPCWGHVIHIGGFGTIRLATLQISQYTRRLSMIHIDLGCAVEGELMVCEIQDGGIEW